MVNVSTRTRSIGRDVPGLEAAGLAAGILVTRRRPAA